MKKQSVVNYFEEREGDMNILTTMANTLKNQTFEKLKGNNNLKKIHIKDYINSNNNK
jgi:methyl-accepting chemotaxis protein